MRNGGLARGGGWLDRSRAQLDLVTWMLAWPRAGRSVAGQAPVSAGSCPLDACETMAQNGEERGWTSPTLSCEAFRVGAKKFSTRFRGGAKVKISFIFQLDGNRLFVL